MKRFEFLLAGLAIVAAHASARADEGMWTFNNFPADRVENAYGFRPDQAWLDRVRLASLRFGNGCSASFVSPRGLVQTNHHCIGACLEQLSTPGKDLSASGFHAREEKDERGCATVEVNQLIEIIPVTERIHNATSGKDGPAFAAALKAERAAVEAECTGNDARIRCSVVELYQGGVYDLYKYRRYQDVRLVFAPEEAIGNFGGDPDNFEFPRYAFDVAYLRVYSDDKPLDSSRHYFRFAKADARPGELVFSSGNPGSTYRLDTVAQLVFRRDVLLPHDIFLNAELRGQLTRFAAEGPAQARSAQNMLVNIENSLKSDKGAFAALVDPTIIKDRMRAEQALRAKVDADPALREQYGAAWDGIRDALDQYRPLARRFALLVERDDFRSTLLRYAQQLVRRADESSKPDGERLSEHTEAAFARTLRRLLSNAPINPDLEKLRLTFTLTKLRELLGPDDAFVKKVLGGKSPAQLAGELIDGTGLANVELRRHLIDADAATLAASTDPMIRFARAIDPELRATRKQRDDGLDAALTKYAGQIAQARFKIEGTSSYPDATSSPRLSYGSVEGYSENGREIGPFTYVAGLYARATGAAPFALPPSWVAAQPALNPQLSFNLVTSNDTVGGDSGSPLLNKDCEIVGVVFDGNIHSLGGDFGFDAALNRTVAVSVGILREGLAKVYRADRLLDELTK